MIPAPSLRIIACAMLLSLLACRPVLAIGWEEIVLLLLLVGIMFGPSLARLYRFWQRMKDATKEEHPRDEKEG